MRKCNAFQTIFDTSSLENRDFSRIRPRGKIDWSSYGNIGENYMTELIKDAKVTPKRGLKPNKEMNIFLSHLTPPSSIKKRPGIKRVELESRNMDLLENRYRVKLELFTKEIEKLCKSLKSDMGLKALKKHTTSSRHAAKRITEILTNSLIKLSKKIDSQDESNRSHLQDLRRDLSERERKLQQYKSYSERLEKEANKQLSLMNSDNQKASSASAELNKYRSFVSTLQVKLDFNKNGKESMDLDELLLQLQDTYNENSVLKDKASFNKNLSNKLNTLKAKTESLENEIKKKDEAFRSCLKENQVLREDIVKVRNEKQVSTTNLIEAKQTLNNSFNIIKTTEQNNVSLKVELEELKQINLSLKQINLDTSQSSKQLKGKMLKKLKQYRLLNSKQDRDLQKKENEIEILKATYDQKQKIMMKECDKLKAKVKSVEAMKAEEVQAVKNELKMKYEQLMLKKMLIKETNDEEEMIYPDQSDKATFTSLAKTWFTDSKNDLNITENILKQSKAFEQKKQKEVSDYRVRIEQLINDVHELTKVNDKLKEEQHKVLIECHDREALKEKYKDETVSLKRTLEEERDRMKELKKVEIEMRKDYEKKKDEIAELRVELKEITTQNSVKDSLLQSGTQDKNNLINELTEVKNELDKVTKSLVILEKERDTQKVQLTEHNSNKLTLSSEVQHLSKKKYIYETRLKQVMFSLNKLKYKINNVKVDFQTNIAEKISRELSLLVTDLVQQVNTFKEKVKGKMKENSLEKAIAKSKEENERIENKNRILNLTDRVEELKQKLESEKECNNTQQSKVTEQETLCRELRLMFLNWISALNRILHLNIEVKSYEDFDPETYLTVVEDKLKAYKQDNSEALNRFTSELEKQVDLTKHLQAEKASKIWNTQKKLNTAHRDIEKVTKLRVELEHFKSLTEELKDSLAHSNKQLTLVKNKLTEVEAQKKKVTLKLMNTNMNMKVKRSSETRLSTSSESSRSPVSGNDDRITFESRIPRLKQRDKGLASTNKVRVETVKEIRTNKNIKNLKELCSTVNATNIVNSSSASEEPRSYFKSFSEKRKANETTLQELQELLHDTRDRANSFTSKAKKTTVKVTTPKKGYLNIRVCK